MLNIMGREGLFGINTVINEIMNAAKMYAFVNINIIYYK